MKKKYVPDKLHQLFFFIVFHCSLQRLLLQLIQQCWPSLTKVHTLVDKMIIHCQGFKGKVLPSFTILSAPGHSMLSTGKQCCEGVGVLQAQTRSVKV